jgi:hypothetical protein
MTNIRHKTDKPIHDPVKSDIYTLGLTILELASLSKF